MSSLKKNLFLSVFGAAMTATVAYAADLPAPPIIEYEPESPIEIGSSWYLRGDLGLAVYQGGRGSWTSATGSVVKWHDDSFDVGGVIGGGFGYYFNEYFRSDITLDYRTKVKYKGKVPCGSLCTYTTESNTFSAWTLMLNGYYDFGTWNSITPYVGAGVGTAWVKVDDYKTDTGYSFKDHGQFNFAWNVMAGASFDLTDELKLDANYRFVSLGETRTGRVNAAAAENSVKFEDLYAHDFRVGLRYDLN
ncbi:Opacity protein [Cohaesibacter sp. ES.047]|uniref:outer membrane protein n=1 Tax=Cohaesibacter sp. ES.047 TaxID=1798205 RepID=UPI000BBF8B79|nr:outer membrane protein [Cohaesibacter sp. ES.047]SNY90989.1 Opacity protein [Cohaesibacter sp. ES.047]